MDRCSKNVRLMGAKVKGIFWMTKMFDKNIFSDPLFLCKYLMCNVLHSEKISLISIQLDVFIRDIFFTNIGVH